ncbi:hypothetical protein ACIGGF_08475 [Rhodococcus sp. NPDC078407]|uniref:Ppx/GppA phosphatase family protein n=1 Tax=Rhodococcus sp. NPDC078407 TaxID=3364509 RepID=UPI0037C9145E
MPCTSGPVPCTSDLRGTLDASSSARLTAVVSRVAGADRAELKGISADRPPQPATGALVAEASMRALSVKSVAIGPWALREGSIVKKLDTETGGDLVRSSS